jgi:hypothetical protein
MHDQETQQLLVREGARGRGRVQGERYLGALCCGGAARVGTPAPCKVKALSAPPAHEHPLYTPPPLHPQEDLTRSTNQAQRVERTVREITTMQQMISTAVMQQAEAIEQLYNVAVEATTNVRRGNEELRKTIAVNRSSTKYIVVLLLVASLLLVLFDWINS